MIKRLLVLLILTALLSLFCSAYDYNEQSVLYSVGEDGLVTIEGYAGYASRLELPSEIDGKTVAYIADTAFFGNKTLSDVTVPSSVTVIGKSAFENCSALHTVVIEGALEIGNSAFRSCDRLSEVSLPSTLISIGESAFEGCIRLGTVYIPPSVTSIGYDAFISCENLTLDASDSPIAEEYAKSNFIAILSEKDHSLTVQAIAFTVILGAVVFIAPKLIKKIKKTK